MSDYTIVKLFKVISVLYSRNVIHTVCRIGEPNKSPLRFSLAKIRGLKQRHNNNQIDYAGEVRNT